MTDDTADLALATREGLPDALRVLLEEYPRNGWTADPGFNELIRFWLDRHLMFRRILSQLREDTERLLDGDIAAETFAPRLSRYGGLFINEMHGHHMIEDSHYFPVLSRHDPRLERGFEILDRDHHTLDARLNALAGAANGVLRTFPGDLKPSAAPLLSELQQCDRLLDRHLEDEEDLIVPVILRHGAAGVM